MRWNYPQASSIGHNVVFVNGEKQIPAKMRKQPWKPGVGGKVEKFESTEQRDYVLMDPTKAYPNNELKSWKRHIVLEKPEITVVLDEVEAGPGSEIEIRFHPGVPFEIIEDFVFLEGENGNMALIPLVNESFKFKAGKHACQYINATQEFFWIDYFDAEIKAESAKTLAATIVLPVENNKEAKEIAASKRLEKGSSGNISISFNKKEKSFLFEYQNTENGLVFRN
jgi:hypothetical protein